MVGEILDWSAGAGFRDVVKAFGQESDWFDAEAYRNRSVVKAIREKPSIG